MQTAGCLGEEERGHDPEGSNEIHQGERSEVRRLQVHGLSGNVQHFTVPIAQLEEGSFEEGYGFDGSSIRGWQAIHASDMLIIPDASTAVMDPFTAVPTISFICNIVDPITKEKYSRDPRNIAQKAEAYLKSTGIADTSYFGPEAEFFIFDDIRYDCTQNAGTTSSTRSKGSGTRAGWRIRTWATRPGTRKAISRCPHGQHERHALRNGPGHGAGGIAVEAQHHEVATGGQAEIDMKFNSLTKIADSLMWYKYILKNVARRTGRP